jgi:hypothetical protein
MKKVESRKSRDTVPVKEFYIEKTFLLKIVSLKQSEIFLIL